jgi:hypothetical protein
MRQICSSVSTKLFQILNSHNFLEKATYSCLLLGGEPDICSCSRPRVNGGSAHAEVDTMNKFFSKNKIRRDANNRKKKYKVDIFVFRMDSEGNLRNAKPCRECSNFIFQSKIIDKVYYTSGNEENPFVYEKSNELSNEFPSLHQFLIDKANGSPKFNYDRIIRRSHRLFTYNIADKLENRIQV